MESLQTLYGKLQTHRTNYLERGRDSSEYTLPFILPREGSSSATDFKNPYSSVGGNGIQSLSSKLVSTLFPTNTPFFDIVLDPGVKARYEQETGVTQGDLQQSMGKITTTVNTYIDTSNYRSVLYSCFLHLLITGNVLLFVKDEKLVLYPLDSFVINKDKAGNLLEIICMEKVSVKSLKEDVITACQLDTTQEEDYVLYTGAVIEEGQFHFRQEINEMEVPGSETTYTNQSLPFIPLQYINSSTDENYGRSLVDTVISDLKVLDDLTKAVLEVSAVSSKMIMLVNPSAEVNVDKLSKAKSGDFVLMKQDDVTALQFQKNNDLGVAYNVIQTIENRLMKVFLYPSDNLNKKDMTATEVRWHATQLEQSLGGAYSNLQNQLQMPLLRIIISQLTKKKIIPEIPTDNDMVSIKIVAGLSGLGQSRDLQALNGFISLVGSLGEQAMASINTSEIITRFANALSIDTAGLVKTKEQMQQEQQQAQQAQERQMLMQAVQQGGVANMQAEAQANAEQSAQSEQPTEPQTVQ